MKYIYTALLTYVGSYGFAFASTVDDRKSTWIAIGVMCCMLMLHRCVIGMANDDRRERDYYRRVRELHEKETAFNALRARERAVKTGG